MPNSNLSDSPSASAEGARLEARVPRSPYDPVDVRATDLTDWVSFPPFHAHVACIRMPDNCMMYVPRMRDSEGRLRFLTEPSDNLETPRRVVDAHWLDVGKSATVYRNKLEEEYISIRWRSLSEREASARELSPRYAQSPYLPVTHAELEALDPGRFPAGYPVVVEGFDPMGRYPDAVFYRTTDYGFRNYFYMTRLRDTAKNIIRQVLYRSTIPSNYIHYCNEHRRKARADNPQFKA